MLDRSVQQDGSYDMGMLPELAAPVRYDAMFGKMDRYEHQFEYRIFWHCKNPSDFIDIEVPDARQFCSVFEADQP